MKNDAHRSAASHPQCVKKSKAKGLGKCLAFNREEKKRKGSRAEGKVGKKTKERKTGPGYTIHIRARRGHLLREKTGKTNEADTVGDAFLRQEGRLRRHRKKRQVEGNEEKQGDWARRTKKG